MLEKSDKNVEYVVVDTTAFIENAPLQDCSSPKEHSPNWVSITSEFLESAFCLKLGELVHVESFTLSEAMTAIEMMDPKLDLGMKSNRYKLLITSFDKAAAVGLLKLDNFTESELIAIMDLSLTSLVSCLEGSFEPNLYLQKPDCIKNKTLKTFCVCLQNIFTIIKELIGRAAVYDDDFQLMHCEYTFDVDISDEKLINKLTNLKHKSNAVSARVNFIKSFYQILLVLLDEQPLLPPEYEILEAALTHLSVIKDTVEKNTVIEVFEGLKMKPQAAFDYLETLMTSFKTINKIGEIREYNRALQFFQAFSKTNPCTLSRSVLQLFYPGSNTKIMKTNPYVLHELLREDSKMFVGPTTQQARFYIDTFLSLCVAPFGTLLKINGFNQTHQRDKILLLLQEFAVLQAEAQKIDSIIVCFSKQFVASFSTWILYHTLQIMIFYLFKGFELELYSTHEYYYIYWYLSEFLYSWLNSALMKANVINNTTELTDSRSKAKRNRRVKNEVNVINVHQEIVYYHAIQNICGGYYQTLLGFRNDRKIRMPCSEFDNEEIRYHHRFEPFHNLVAPPYIEYKQFHEKTATVSCNENDSSRLYQNGCDQFGAARQLLENFDKTNEEIAILIKVCKANIIFLRLLIGGYKKHSDVMPEFNFSLHKCFPTMKFS